MIEDEKFPRVGIGVAIIDKETRARLELEGVIIAEVFPGSSAEKAGLVGVDRRTGQLGDIIVKVERKTVGSVAQLSSALGHVGIGNTVELTIIQNKRKKYVKLKVADIS